MTPNQTQVLRVFLMYIFIKLMIVAPLVVVAVVNYLYDKEK